MKSKKAELEEVAYTYEELQDPTKRPRVREGQKYLVTVLHIKNLADDARTRYFLVSPCCGIRTIVWQHDVERLLEGEVATFQCGKSWHHTRGRSQRGGCRAQYQVTPRPNLDKDNPYPSIFELQWTGR